MSSNSANIKDIVRERYGSLAKKHSSSETAIPLQSSCCTPAESSCCGPTEASLAESLYSQTDLEDLSAGVTGISLGCGNPPALAGLKSGETVLDLGSGGGIDCFIAAKAVGPAGRVIGVDMTDEMLALANQNKTRLGLTNVEFRKGEIEALPVESNTVDVIISNCVINLSPDKAAVFGEAYRVLKPGGRFTVSDIVTEGEIPALLRANLNAWAECLAGAIDQERYLEQLRQAGFTEAKVQSRTAYGPEALELLDETARRGLLEGLDLSAISTSFKIYSANIVAYK